ncbi:MAG: GNAT family N-acetyltransferase [Actinomycetota bacterium]|nr:GNAT family N-acetyltransferase [Actinomycetota bacterium]
MTSLTDIWPLAGLRLRTGDLELRFPSDADLAELAAAAMAPVHDPQTMAFSTPWTDAPPTERARGVLQWHWSLRGSWSPEQWTLGLVAVRAGVVVGTQDISGGRFDATHEVLTGSWVAAAHQGVGIGTAMRRAVLHLAFAGLGARTARSGAFLDNEASLRVSEKLGYVPDGTEVHAPRGTGATMTRLLLVRSVWVERSPRWPAVEIEGLDDACLSMFGLPAAA